ncbi:MAG: hypothetical protein JO125_00155 [Chloroflexi bacterium]|nr:hypothetical protein [Ktedonobacteraceae bacterium]MBV9705803.1 hypothetical protein [Chloroflexota bacterium]
MVSIFQHEDDCDQGNRIDCPAVEGGGGEMGQGNLDGTHHPTKVDGAS